MSTFKTILTLVATHREVSISDILHPTRVDIETANCRFEVCWLARELTNMSYPKIGKELGGRDHSTIMHAVRNIEKTMEHDELYADDMREMKIMVELTLQRHQSVQLNSPKGVDVYELSKRIVSNTGKLEIRPHEVIALATSVLAAHGEFIATFEQITVPTLKRG